MEKFLEALRGLLADGDGVALATVVARSGSAPRDAGARMLVGRSGRLWGTVGGGLVEHEAELLAMETLRSGTSALREFCLRAEGLERIGMVCGGDVTLAVQYLPGGAAGPLAAADAALRCLRAGGDGWLVSRLSTAEAGDLSFLEKEAAEIRFSALRQQAADEVLFEAEGKPWFAQRLIRSGAVYLFGGGHVARELAPLLARLDFCFMVLDDRAEFAVPADFPGAKEVLCADFGHILDAVAPGAGDYAVVMTRGHLFDLDVQKQLLTTPVGYIGVMGSRKKKEFVFERLREAGFSDWALSRIVTPVGLPLGGETPAEIALSVAAQLVQLRAERKGRVWKREEGENMR